MKCPFCGTELKECFVGLAHLSCSNIKCDYASIPLFPKVWQALIDGKKAQRQLRTIKDRCAKTIKAKEREIANYLNGISVRDREIQTLREQLQKAQDALKGIKQTLDECFLSDKSGFTVFWDNIARRLRSAITHSTKQEFNNENN